MRDKEKEDEIYFMAKNRKDFQSLTNKERAEIYADMKVHNDTYLASDFSILKKIHQTRFESLRKLMGDISNKIVLDCGAGEGFFLSSVKAKEKYGIEISEKRITKASALFPDLKIQLGDIRNLPFEDKTFDVIVCSEVLEHVSGYEKAIEEFKRCVKPDGKIVLSFPNEFTVSLGRLLLLKFPTHELDHINSIRPKDVERLLGKKYKTLNVPNIRYPFCLYQVYRFDAIDFK